MRPLESRKEPSGPCLGLQVRGSAKWRFSSVERIGRHMHVHFDARGANTSDYPTPIEVIESSQRIILDLASYRRGSVALLYTSDGGLGQTGTSLQHLPQPPHNRLVFRQHMWWRKATITLGADEGAIVECRVESPFRGQLGAHRPQPPAGREKLHGEHPAVHLLRRALCL